jgi:outer membrane protein
LNKFYKIILFLIIHVFCFFSGNSQDISFFGLPSSWSLEDCISYAKNKNISIANLRLNSKLAQEDLLQVRAGVFPNLSGSISQNLINSKSLQSSGAFQSKVNSIGNYFLSSSLVIYNGGYLKNDIISKEYSFQSANLSLLETENSLSLSISQAFFNILISHEIMVAFQSIIETSTGQLKQGQERLDAGSLSKKDFLLLRAIVASDQYNLINASNDLRLNTVILKQFLLLPTNYNLIVVIPEILFLDSSSTPLLKALEIARNTRPEIKNQIILIQKSEVDLEKSKAALKPLITVGANLSSGYAYNEGDIYFNQIGNNFYQSIGVTMGIPIYSRRINKTNINKSKILLQQSNLAFYETKTLLDQQIEQTFINLENARAQYKSAEIQLKTASEIYRISNEQLKIGSLNSVDLLLQKNIYIQALQLFTQVKYKVLLYHKIYAFYMGIPITL